MNIPSNDRPRDSAKTWNRLANEARSVPPPADVDVRFSVRAALMSQQARPFIQVAPAGRSIVDDLVLLAQSMVTRFVLAGCATLAAFSLLSGYDAFAGLSAVADLQGGLFVSSYITP